MKKILFILTFAFIGHHAFSQMYIVTIYQNIDINTCPYFEFALKTTDPSGNTTTLCVPNGDPAHPQGYTIDHSLGVVNQELNSIMSQGYKLVNVSGEPPLGSYLFDDFGFLRKNIVFLLAQPWSSSGLEEISTTLNNISINPNPANSFVDISLDYPIKGKSEVVFINEGGYIIYKESIQGILKNEKYNIDISKLFAGKYLVTIVNGQTYTTPQKLIVF